MSISKSPETTPQEPNSITLKAPDSSIEYSKGTPREKKKGKKKTKKTPNREMSDTIAKLNSRENTLESVSDDSFGTDGTPIESRKDKKSADISKSRVIIKGSEFGHRDGRGKLANRPDNAYDSSPGSVSSGSSNEFKVKNIKVSPSSDPEIKEGQASPKPY